MKLLYITNSINGSGGLERVLSIKASILADTYDYEVHLLVLNNGYETPFYNFSKNLKFHTINVGGNAIAYIMSYRQGVQQMINEVKPDIISVCDDGLKAFFLPRLIKTNAKWVYERHVSKLVEQQSNQSFVRKTSTKLKWRMMEKLGNDFSKFIVLTEANKKEWTRLNNLIIIGNPLTFFPEQVSSLNNKIVLCVGRIAFQKGQDLLLDAWKIVSAVYPDWELHLYGKSNVNFLDTENLGDGIHYFPPAKNIQEKYLGSSIYVMPSRFEGFGMVLIEAMACGVPCVSFNCDYGPSDIIKDQVNGFLVDKEDVQSLADRIIDLISDISLRKELGANARTGVQPFAIESIIKQWDVMFKALRS